MSENGIKTRNYALDFVKIIATICIICHHYQIYNRVGFNQGINFYGGIFYFGYLVELFFVISGFLTSRYIYKIQSGMTLSQFIVPKWKRFFVPQLLSCGVFSILLILYERVYHEVYWERSFTLWGYITASLGLSESAWGVGGSKINGTIWYISVLLFCFFVFYVINWIGKKIKINVNWLFLLMIFLGFQIKMHEYSSMWIDTSMARGYVAFFWGVILGEYVERCNGISAKKYIIALVIVILFPIAFILWHDTYLASGQDYLLVFLFYTSIIILTQNGYVRRIFKFKIFGEIGEVSFEAYMWHFPIILGLSVVNGAMNWNLDFASRKNILLVVLVSYAVGAAMHYGIDKTFVKRWIAKKS